MDFFLSFGESVLSVCILHPFGRVNISGWSPTPPDEEHFFYICSLLCHVIEVKPEFRMKSSQRYIKSWEQVMLRMYDFLEWISKSAAMHVTMELHSFDCENLLFLERSAPGLKMVFESSLPHKLVQLSPTMVGIMPTFRSGTHKSNSVFCHFLLARHGAYDFNFSHFCFLTYKMRTILPAW